MFCDYGDLRKTCYNNNQYQIEIRKKFWEGLDSVRVDCYEGKIYIREVHRLQAVLQKDSLKRLQQADWTGLRHNTDSYFVCPSTYRLYVYPLQTDDCSEISAEDYKEAERLHHLLQGGSSWRKSKASDDSRFNSL
jgi:hypothetical protein